MPEDDQDAVNRSISAPPIRTLLVDDYEPFRHHVRAMLQARVEFQVIGGASDGLAAVQNAEELQPELSLRDRTSNTKRNRSCPSHLWTRSQRDHNLRKSEQ
jgi:DNA-binding NarL/FixJ family response regulator